MPGLRSEGGEGPAAGVQEAVPGSPSGGLASRREGWGAAAGALGSALGPRCWQAGDGDGGCSQRSLPSGPCAQASPLVSRGAWLRVLGGLSGTPGEPHSCEDGHGAGPVVWGSPSPGQTDGVREQKGAELAPRGHGRVDVSLRAPATPPQHPTAVVGARLTRPSVGASFSQGHRAGALPCGAFHFPPAAGPKGRSNPQQGAGWFPSLGLLPRSSP